MERKIHILAVPYPAAGHITPLLHFTKRLASKGLKITMVIPTINCKSSAMAASSAHQQFHDELDFKIEYISDGSENDDPSISAKDYLIRLKAEISKNLTLFIEKMISHNDDDDDDDDDNILPCVLVYDSTMPWVLEIAHQHGMRGAAFFAESCFIHCIYYNIFQGNLNLSSILNDQKSVISLPPLPPLEIDDLPCHPTFRSFTPAVLEDFYANKFPNLHKADWIFINTFDNLETELVSWMASKWPIKTIGPTIVDDGFIKGSSTDDDELQKKKKKSDYSCMEWLDRRETNSVVYISFGTIAKMSQEQMEAIGRGLISSNCSFLWIVRGEEKSKLSAEIRSEISSLTAEGKGIILEWCPQLEVLGHKAVACFMTHCGWNSTVEALSSGVPMIAVPRLLDQMTNAKFIADVWEAGVRVKADSKGSFSSEEIEMCIKEVTQSKRGKELKQNAVKWKQEIEKAIASGGSSAKNIDAFLQELSSMYISNKQ